MLSATVWLAVVALTAAQSPAPGSARQAPPAPAADALAAQAARAESNVQIDAARNRLYQLLIEQPGTADAHQARLRLARLLALSGSTPEALAECQLLRDELAGDHPLRQRALDMATLLGRRLRASQGPAVPYFAVSEGVVVRGLQSLDEPTVIVVERAGRWALLDQGAKRAYLVTDETAAAVATPRDPSGMALLPDGNLAIAGSTGLATTGTPRTVPMAGTWRGRSRQAGNVRSMAALSDGGLLVLDEDFDGILRCEPPTGACAPWGPVGKFQEVRVGPSDWVYLLDDRGQSFRVLDGSQHLSAAFGPMVGGLRLEKVEDMAVDAVHGVYLLDTKAKRIAILNLTIGPDGTMSAAAAATILLPQEGSRAMKNPSAIGVGPDGSLIVASRSSPRIERYR